ncbi:hypothetical protein [Chitinophaga flava]|uniref:hypothetical protein n=1 Tax=Chitinophaga flava TaxID=2259036 RepID=UPI000DE36C33|nr:hypothetical protein [Chitinophaga flava]
MKTWLYLPLLLLGLVFSSCTKTTNEVIPNNTFLFDVQPSGWTLDNQGVYFVQFNIPSLDRNANQLDGVIVSLARQQNGNFELYEMLPEVFNNENYNVIHQTGTLLVELRGPNNTRANAPNVPMRFKIVVIPSNQR